jgi:PAS domain S-box-containing protein
VQHKCFKQTLKGILNMDCFDSSKILSKECLHTIFQTMAEGLIIIDSSGIIRFCNKSFENMTGTTKENILGKQCKDFINCNNKEFFRCLLLKDGLPINNLECQLKTSKGSMLLVLLNSRPIKENDSIIGAVETLNDISQLKISLCKNAVLEEEIKKISGNFSLLIGKSKKMQEVYELIQLASASNATVLITGETGTGKELVAKTIHNNSMRKNGPFVKVNCSALTESLLESELFGHVKGAFTGAIKDKIGRFELADQGTLFLDEIGEISPYIQVKLLRFLQEKEFERVGESQTIKADVRIIAATNKDLKQLIKKGDFREDLYYRLKIFPIHLPPLRERKEDIRLLINHFINKFNKETGKSITGLSAEAALIMMDYCWPGNIRELENAIEHAFVTCQENEIGVFDLPIEIRHVELRKETCFSNEAKTDKKELTKDNIIYALSKYNGNKLKAANELGINRTTLWRYIKKLKIE